MRESIGGAQVLIIVVTILLVMIILLTASISYTKAFKARNTIINIVEKYAAKGETAAGLLEKTINDSGDTVEDEIDEFFESMGYMLSLNSTTRCEQKINKNEKNYEDCGDGHNYNYSIYHFVDEENKAEYYGVLTYMYFEIPMFGRDDRFVFPIYGNTVSLRGVAEDGSSSDYDWRGDYQ